MKRNIYSYSKLWIIFFVLMGAACTNQVEDVIPVSGQPIEFSVQSDWKEIPNTRSNPGKPNFTGGEEIQIFGFHKSSLGDEVKFMYRVGGSESDQRTRGQIVKLEGGNWNYSPKRFWPKEGTLDFYAGYPEYSVLKDEENPKKMTYKQDVNSLQLDLLWGVSTGHNCTKDRSSNVVITMKHALARVNITFDSSLGEIKQAEVSAYYAGYFYLSEINQGIPHWIIDTTSDKYIQEVTFPTPGNQPPIGDVDVFILPDKITGLILTKDDGEKIDASEKIKEYTFEAGKVYNLTISKGVQKKNTKTRSIAMSVRCVSE